MLLDYLSVPTFAILINQKPLKDSITWQISRITVDDQIDLPSMFTLELEVPEETKSQAGLLNNKKLFAIGNDIDIKLGYGNNLEQVISSEVTFMELEYRADSLPRMTVRGYDRRHRLQRGHKIRTFLNKKDSDIAKQIANEAGISITVTDSEVTHDYMVQANQTDFAFLQELARRINYELVMRDKSLLFRPVNFDDEPIMSLSMDKQLTRFAAQFSVTSQITQATVQGWNIAEKKIFSATCSKLGSKQGALIGPQLVAKEFGEAARLFSDEPVANLQEAKKRADGEFAASALSLVRGEGECPGENKLKAGVVVEIQGVDSRARGHYYVTAVTHNYSLNGYTTHFTAWRNAT
jgi:uncharacterized protein